MRPKQYPSPQRIKQDRIYTYAEAAEALGKHRNTIANWVRDGLRRVDDRKPYLINGSALKAFLAAKRAQRKKPCRPGELYCMRCKEPRKAAGAMADFQPLTPTVGDLIALCVVCGTLMHRRTRTVDLARVARDLEISSMEGRPHIGDSPAPS